MITMKQLGFILAPALLGVLVAGEFKILPENLRSRKAGTMLILTCLHSAGDATPDDLNMVWKDPRGQVIPERSPNKMVQKFPSHLKLVFISLSKADEGTYQCEGTINNQVESATKDVIVMVETSFLSPEQQSLINGTDAKVWCRLSQSVAANQTMKWYRDLGDKGLKAIVSGGRYVVDYDTTAGQHGGFLLIQQVDISDSGEYLCSLENMVEGTAAIFNIEVIVTVPPMMIPIYLDPTDPKEGDNLTMTCHAEGVPPPTYMFYKGSRMLMEKRNTNGIFKISGLNRRDEGLYTCNALNAGGSQNETVLVNVKIPPAFESTENVSANEGDRETMSCVATGDPAPSMSWKRKDSQVDFLSRNNSKTGSIYQELSEQTPNIGGEIPLYRRTLDLVFPALQPQDAGLYVCRADNQYGVKEKTFRVDVLFKPNFQSQRTRVFYGWKGSTTNLTCRANGNPEPIITWFRNGQKIEKNDSNYRISLGDSGIATQAISYLEPRVTSANMGTVFGEYKCRGYNKFDMKEQPLTFKQAVPPEMSTVSVLEAKATELELRINSPRQDGGQPVVKYVVRYRPSDTPNVQDKERNFTRFPNENSTRVILDGLVPITQYSIKVYAVNNVGLGAEKRIVVSTDNFSKPDPVKVLSSRQGVSGSTFELMWNIPMNGGDPIENYVVEYIQVDVVESGGDWKVAREVSRVQNKIVMGEANTRITLTGLKKTTFYRATITAVNKRGSSNPTDFVFSTGLGVGPSGGTDCVRGGSVAGMLLVVMVTALFPPPLLL